MMTWHPLETTCIHGLFFCTFSVHDVHFIYTRTYMYMQRLVFKCSLRHRLVTLPFLTVRLLLPLLKYRLDLYTDFLPVWACVMYVYMYTVPRLATDKYGCVDS